MVLTTETSLTVRADPLTEIVALESKPVPVNVTPTVAPCPALFGASPDKVGLAGGTVKL